MREKCVGAAPWRNLLIEGDNYDALRYLRMAFTGQVKCILIDPPYNTGKNDFIYNDSFVTKEDSWRFSTWMEFMYRRLMLARDLLSEDGVMLCCISDEEIVPNLSCLIDKVFPGIRAGSGLANTQGQRAQTPTSPHDMNMSFFMPNADSSFAGNDKWAERNTIILIMTRVGRGSAETRQKHTASGERANAYYPV